MGVGAGDVRGVRNFSRFPTPGHPFYLAHYEVDHEAGPGEVWGREWKRSDDDDDEGEEGGSFSFSPSTDIPSVAAGTFTSGLVSSHRRGGNERGIGMEERGRREGERERRGISFSPSPILLDELARYRVARRSNAAPGRAEGAEGTRRRKKGRERGLGCLDRSPEMDTENRHYKLTSLIDGQRARDDAGGREETRGGGGEG